MGNLPQSKVAEVVPNTLTVDRNTLKIELHNSLTLPETRVSLWVRSALIMAKQSYTCRSIYLL